MAVPYWYIFWVSSEKICNNFVNYSKIFPVSYIHNLMFWIETLEAEQGTNTSKGKECPHPPAPHSSHLQSHGPGSSMCLIQTQLWWQKTTGCTGRRDTSTVPESCTEHPTQETPGARLNFCSQRSQKGSVTASGLRDHLKGKIHFKKIPFVNGI